MKIIFNFSKIKKKYYFLDKYIINYVSSINKPCNNSLIFLTDENYSKELKVKNSILLCTKNSKVIINRELNHVEYFDNPKFHFINILKNSFISLEKKKSYIHPDIILDRSVYIAKNNVIIEKGTKIFPGVKIFENSHIGKNVVIGPNTVIGYQGFNIDRNKEDKFNKIPLNGKPHKFPHLGGVIIKDCCDIGALNIIASGTIDPTVLEKNVMSDDNVHIAHNCQIKNGVALAAGVKLSGGVNIGENSWLGTGAIVMQKIKIGKKSIIGMGAVIFRDTPNNSRWLGNPAKKIGL